MSKGWLYAIILVLAAALAFETGYLVKSHAGLEPRRAQAEERKPAPPPAALVSGGLPFESPLFGEEPAWDPFTEMLEMQRAMNRLFRESNNRRALLSPHGSAGASFDPDVDVRETPSAYLVRVDLPGIEKDKIDVAVRDGVLTISGRRESAKEDEGKGTGIRRLERSFGAFRRTLALPPDADSSGMTAESVEGVLTVRIPRRPPATAEEPRSVKVN